MHFVSFILVVIVLLFLLSRLRVIKQYQGGVILRLGKFHKEIEPGLTFIFPIIDSLQRIDKRVVAIELDSQDIITKDSVPMTLTAIVYYKAISTRKALLDVANYKSATVDIAQTVLRSQLSQHTLDAILTNQSSIDEALKNELDRHTEDWGVQITSVQIKTMDLPESMKRAMAKEAEAERERKAKIIAAQGELEASEKLTEAARKIAEVPSAMVLRQLQTLTEIGAEHNTTILFPYEMSNQISGVASALAMKNNKQD